MLGKSTASSTATWTNPPNPLFCPSDSSTYSDSRTSKETGQNNPPQTLWGKGDGGIFKTEVPPPCSVEQLFINFANEKLQKFFVDHIFRQEQEEYQREEIAWTNIRFNDNREIVDLLAVKPCNLLALIDEESQFPRVGARAAFLRIPVEPRCLYEEKNQVCLWRGRVLTSACCRR